MIIERETLRWVLVNLYDMVEAAKARQDAGVLIVLANAIERLDAIEVKRYADHEYAGNRFS